MEAIYSDAQCNSEPIIEVATAVGLCYQHLSAAGTAQNSFKFAFENNPGSSPYVEYKYNYTDLYCSSTPTIAAIDSGTLGACKPDPSNRGEGLKVFFSPGSIGRPPAPTINGLLIS